ncbi:hypothetical protein SVIOM342S_09281 [Streptomyces violaceorubidus]
MTRYYNESVNAKDDGTAALVYCEDQSKSFNKFLKSGKTERRHVGDEGQLRPVCEHTAQEQQGRLGDGTTGFGTGECEVPAMNRRNALILPVGLAALLLTTAGPAHAEKGFGGATDGQTEQHAEAGGDGTVSVSVGGVVFDRSKNGSGDSVGPVTSATSWSPPACWYAPKFSPQELQDYLEPIWEAESTGYQWDAEQREKYNAKDDKKGFHKDKTGQGYWWGSVCERELPAGLGQVRHGLLLGGHRRPATRGQGERRHARKSSPSSPTRRSVSPVPR